MDARFFLTEECRSVRAALNETLRHDYGPDLSRQYFGECDVRLKVVERALNDDPAMDQRDIAAHMQTLSALSSRISFIERAHLGEFSWPFSEVLRDMASRLFVESGFDEDLNEIEVTPIVHIVAEGADYQIVNDPVTPPGDRRIIIVAFPRQLKHCVLLHAIFGHELGHTAMEAERTGQAIRTKVMPAISQGPLQDCAQAKRWLQSESAPQTVRDRASEADFEFKEGWLVNWRKEIVCDLFGLLLFGPAFAAAHRTIIGSMCPHPNHVDLGSTTHPPYPVRQSILSRAISIMGWDRAISSKEDGTKILQGELDLIEYATQRSDNDWFGLLDDRTIEDTVARIGEILEAADLSYRPIEAGALQRLARRLSFERPPILDEVTTEGTSDHEPVGCAQTLYAGWCYWFGREELAAVAQESDGSVEPLTFLSLNRLCDHALLQEHAIRMSMGDAA